MTVMSMVVGEDLPRFLKGDPISCGYCKQPLDLGMVLPVLDSKAAAAYQSALCTIAALEAEKNYGKTTTCQPCSCVARR